MTSSVTELIFNRFLGLESSRDDAHVSTMHTPIHRTAALSPSVMRALLPAPTSLFDVTVLSPTPVLQTTVNHGQQQ
ncbi:hypothetical protein [Prosthecobacter vanneervenii]|uniref:Uncharacterized protein n=1 Tax=Prosthecobacter vanneervenii TaxID=48466 RepID=A0A7W7YAG5_9BACT|nr:hypothetical protein [Prosthecobacter vanneervenii]MBB5032397.1 hypothetical protein [Prosthecobacter vanneervenii]